MGLSAMCEEGIKKGGIPKSIQLSMDEALQLLSEIHYLANEGETVCMFNIESQEPLADLEDPFHPARIAPMFKAKGDSLNDHTKLVAAGFIVCGKLTLTYQYNEFVIPLLVDPAPKKAESDRETWMKS